MISRMSERGISPILSTVLIVLVVIALAGTFLVYTQRTSTALTERGAEQRQQLTSQTGQGIQILALDCNTGNDEITVRNSGGETYDYTAITTYVDDAPDGSGAGWTLVRDADSDGDFDPDDTAAYDGGADFVDSGQTVRVTTPEGVSDSTRCA